MRQCQAVESVAARGEDVGAAGLGAYAERREACGNADGGADGGAAGPLVDKIDELMLGFHFEREIAERAIHRLILVFEVMQAVRGEGLASAGAPADRSIVGSERG